MELPELHQYMSHGTGVELRLFAKVVIACLLGGVIGYEREGSDKPAGLRTHMLVAMSSALLLGLGEVMVLRFPLAAGGQAVRSDPIRIMQAIIMGIGFLGAGTIFHHRGRGYIEGLTTAASLLMAAAIGMAVVLELFVLSGLMTLAALLVLISARVSKYSKG